MAILDTFTTVSNGDQLDDGYFNGIDPALRVEFTRANSTTLITRTGVTTYGTVGTLVTPAANRASQTVLVECWIYGGPTANSAQYKIVDDTAVADIQESTTIAQFQGVYLQGVVTLASVDDTKTISLQHRITNSGQTVNTYSYYLKCTLVP